jgi:hypothetical protein
MPHPEDAIARIVAQSGVASASGRRDLERELRAHMEDVREAAREAGCDEQEIERSVMLRFGDPDDVADQFAQTYRAERVARYSVHVLVLLIVSFATVATLICTVQATAAIARTGSLAGAFPRIRWELLGFASLSAGYLSAYFGEKIFERGRWLKTIVLNIGVLALLGTVLYIYARGHMIQPVAVFSCASASRLLRITHVRLVWLVGIAVPMSVAWYLAGPFVEGNNAAGQWYLLPLVCADLAVSCRILEAITGVFDRRIDWNAVR